MCVFYESHVHIGLGIENQLQLQNQILVVKLRFKFHLSIPVCTSLARAVKNVFVFESFIQEIDSKTLIHPVMKRVNLE